MAGVLRSEFRWKNVWFGHHKPEAFYTAQWRWHPGLYIAYRFIVACYSVACLLAIEIWTNSANSLAYLTIWTYTILCLYQVSSLFVCVICLVRGRGSDEIVTESSTLVNPADKNKDPREKETVLAVENLGYVEEGVKMHVSNGKVSTISNGSSGHNTTDIRTTSSVTDFNSFQTNTTCWYMKVTWCLADMVYVFGIIVTVVYFVALFPSIGVTSGFIHDLNMHAFNTVQILIDIVIVARPVRLLHLFYPALYGFCYVIFSIIYWSQDKTNNVLYPDILDWNKPGTTFTSSHWSASTTVVIIWNLSSQTPYL